MTHPDGSSRGSTRSGHGDAAEDARHATIDAGRVTAEALSANLEHMKSVEPLRRVYRDLKDLKNLDSN